jgi:hypothetical protein
MRARRGSGAFKHGLHEIMRLELRAGILQRHSLDDSC